ncbi:uncharacterized protein LOC26535102 [Drosophila yakuba]|uniref:Uncharacterized protein n=1 Tax=Drosophila yakuba TaxID=7245 RepID=A0A0R1E9X9_DROYA|nr:uncharacterized protein LOC26535102 [Drosophila yakuba]XP_039229737.1 uncharacterized protein LOC26535102 [Drosophila yakuba]KRK06009.1 uncharacterized protein Dyak_GE27921 [Drosophila yakuba]
MQEDAKDIIPEKLDFEEEVSRLMIEYDVILIAEWDESIFEENELEDDHESDHNTSSNDNTQ